MVGVVALHCGIHLPGKLLEFINTPWIHGESGESFMEAKLEERRKGVTSG